MVQKLFIWKMATVVSVVFFLSYGIADVEGAAKCVFDPAKEEKISSYCVNTKFGEAKELVKNYLINEKGACTDYNSCFGSIVSPAALLVYENCFAGGCYKESDMSGKTNLMVSRYYCGWKKAYEKMCNEETPECMKNWSSCSVDQSDINNVKCLLAPDYAKKLCNSFLKPDECESAENVNFHGCRWETDVLNKCYCQTNQSAAAGGNAETKDLIYEKVANESDTCVDLPFSKADTYYKCSWFQDDIEKASDARSDIANKPGYNGCWCATFNEKSTSVKNDILDQKACESYVFTNDEIQFCAWKEDDKVVSKKEKTLGTTHNGCYCNKDKAADTSNLDQGWNKDTAAEGQLKDSCINIQKIVAGSWQKCVWVENNEIKDSGTAQGKEGCYCNTVKDLNLTFQPKLSQSEAMCVDAPAKEHRPTCEWWAGNKMIKSVTNKEATNDINIPSSTKYSPIPFFIPSTASLNKIGTTDPKQFVGRLITTLMGILGSIALVMFIYGGILYMTDLGSEERVTKAKHIVVWTALGLAVIFASYAILKIVFEAVV